ncbi:hypothetical protein Hanom_Chr04g00359911 [Helianthus anomalus]
MFTWRTMIFMVFMHIFSLLRSAVQVRHACKTECCFFQFLSVSVHIEFIV